MRPTKQTTQLQIALLGMDERSCKIMSMFFKGPCEGHAVVVEEQKASVAIVDTRFEHSKQLLEQILAQGDMRAIIVLSSQSADRIIHDKVMYLDKPITANPMFEALDWAKDISEGKKRGQPLSVPKEVVFAPIPTEPPHVIQRTPDIKPASTSTLSAKLHDNNHQIAQAEIAQEPARAPENEPSDIKNKNLTPVSVYPTSIQMEESDFAEFIGTIIDVDLNDPVKQRSATYDPDKYYQGYIQRAFNQALDEKTVLQLTLGWNPLIILPHSKQIWWDADDKLLKAVSDIEVNIKTVTPVAVAQNELDESTIPLEKKQDMDAFLWKLSIWSSRGRYPQSIDIDSPIQLKRWPNFTRHIVTPHALRISALLIKEGPDTMIGIANMLNIELRYVSVFISAASALNLIRQVPRPRIDEIVTPISRGKLPKPKNSILNKIINKLLGR